jgi:hypothetical protein
MFWDSMLTQYDELRAARGRTLALEHDTTQDDMDMSRLTDATGMYPCASILTIQLFI